MKRLLGIAITILSVIPVTGGFAQTPYFPRPAFTPPPSASGTPAAPQLPAYIPAPNRPDLSLPQQRGIFCARLAAATQSVEIFARCSGQEIILPDTVQNLIGCVELSPTTNQLGLCVATNTLNRNLTRDQRVAVECVTRTGGVMNDFISCIGQAHAGQMLSRDQIVAINCMRNTSGNVTNFASCVGNGYVGRNLSRDQQAAIECVAQSRGDATGFATCAGNKALNNQLNPEQQIAVQCVVSSGGQVYAAAACTATRLTLRELQKCVTDGIGGNGCFGDSGDLVGRNGWTSRTLGNAWHDVTRGPGSTNDLFGGQSVLGQSLETLRRNAPPPIQIGSVGGHRVCAFWC